MDKAELGTRKEIKKYLFHKTNLRMNYFTPTFLFFLGA